MVLSALSIDGLLDALNLWCCDALGVASGNLLDLTFTHCVTSLCCHNNPHILPECSVYVQALMEDVRRNIEFLLFYRSIMRWHITACQTIVMNCCLFNFVLLYYLLVLV